MAGCPIHKMAVLHLLGQFLVQLLSILVTMVSFWLDPNKENVKEMEHGQEMHLSVEVSVNLNGTNFYCLHLSELYMLQINYLTLSMIIIIMSLTSTSL